VLICSICAYVFASYTDQQYKADLIRAEFNDPVVQFRANEWYLRYNLSSQYLPGQGREETRTTDVSHADPDKIVKAFKAIETAFNNGSSEAFEFLVHLPVVPDCLSFSCLSKDHWQAFSKAVEGNRFQEACSILVESPVSANNQKQASMLGFLYKCYVFKNEQFQMFDRNEQDRMRLKSSIDQQLKRTLFWQQYLSWYTLQQMITPVGAAIMAAIFGVLTVAINDTSAKIGFSVAAGISAISWAVWNYLWAWKKFYLDEWNKWSAITSERALSRTSNFLSVFFLVCQKERSFNTLYCVHEAARMYVKDSKKSIEEIVIGM